MREYLRYYLRYWHDRLWPLRCCIYAAILILLWGVILRKCSGADQLLAEQKASYEEKIAEMQYEYAEEIAELRGAYEELAKDYEELEEELEEELITDYRSVWERYDAGEYSVGGNR